MLTGLFSGQNHLIHIPMKWSCLSTSGYFACYVQPQTFWWLICRNNIFALSFTSNLQAALQMQEVFETTFIDQYHGENTDVWVNFSVQSWGNFSWRLWAFRSSSIGCKDKNIAVVYKIINKDWQSTILEIVGRLGLSYVTYHWILREEALLILVTILWHCTTDWFCVLPLGIVCRWY